MKISSAVTSRDRGRDWIQGNRIPFDSGRIEVDRSDHGERSWWNVRRTVAGELCKVDVKRNRSQRNPVTFARRYENQRHVQLCRSELNFTNRSSRNARWASYCKFFPPPHFHRLHEKSTFTLLYASFVVLGVEFSIPRRNRLAEPFNILLLISRRDKCYLQMTNDTKGEIGNLLP